MAAVAAGAGAMMMSAASPSCCCCSCCNVQSLHLRRALNLQAALISSSWTRRCCRRGFGIMAVENTGGGVRETITFVKPPKMERRRTRGSSRRARSMLISSSEEKILSQQLEPDLQETNSDEVAILGNPNSCPLPESTTSTSDQVTLLNPMKLLLPPLPQRLQTSDDDDAPGRPLLLYVPGMDCTGQGIRTHLPGLSASGYDVRCVCIPTDDRSSWQQLVQKLLPLVQAEVKGVHGSRHLTVFGESFGGCLAIRLALAAPDLVSQLVLLNPATNFAENNALASFCSRTGLLAFFPGPLYGLAQDILLPLMVKRNRVSTLGNEDLLSPIDYVPAPCAAWRFSMLNDNSGLSDHDIKSITVPTLLFAAAKDRVLSSLTECARLKSLLPNAKRVILPESGHTFLLEDGVDLVSMLHKNGFTHPYSSPAMSPSTDCAAFQGGPLNLNSSPQSHLPLKKRKDEVPDDVMDELGRILEPWRILTSPLVTGTENLPNPGAVPRRPVLFVGNHTMFGIYDSPILVHELFLRGFRCRGLAHPGHWTLGVGPIFQRYGSVKASKFAAYKLLKEGEDVLLFPGGSREVCKRRGEEYKLMWKPTVDFVRMASRLNAIIVPFGILGADEAYKIIFDGDDMLRSPIGPLLRALYAQLQISTDNIYPLTALPFLNLPSIIPIPSIERIYIHFGKSIDTANYGCKIDNKDECKELYLLVKKRVEDSIDMLKGIREQDPERSLPARLLAKAERLLPEITPRAPGSK
ncbi:hypothetical protein BDL97_04G003500 [Sphagnum fallax]|nr:hypothetical protein BDL97_04G003500 [Sphagnum fallax]